MVGTDYPYSNFLPQKGAVIQIDERAQVLGRRAPTALGVVGSARPTLKLLLDRSRAKSDTKFWDQGDQRAPRSGMRCWTSRPIRRAARIASIRRQWPARSAISPSPMRYSCSTPGLNTLWSANWIRQSGSQRIIGSFNNAAVGTALGQANGIQALDRSRQVIALCGDGGFNMLMCEFLTAVHHKLPVKVVIYNNSAFGLICAGGGSRGLASLPREGIEFPNPDFAALARACGGHGFTATKAGELEDCDQRGFEVDGPAIVDAVVVADEMPNLPHIDLETSGISPWQRSRKPFSP